MHHSGKIEHILRREEERPQHLQVIGPVKGQLAQADVIRYAGIIEHRRNGGDEQYPRHADAQTAFQDAGRNFAGIFAQIRPGALAVLPLTIGVLLMATAEMLVLGLARGDLDWRNIVNPKTKPFTA